MRFKNILVTGGCGFIGSAFIRYLLQSKGGLTRLVNLDALTYAANLEGVATVQGDPRYVFVEGDILDQALVAKLLEEHNIDAIVHFAAESHVDRSILSPSLFYRVNVEGTIALLEQIRAFQEKKQRKIWFHHISTDEVYGSIEQGSFTEASSYAPRSPYAASKAASDHFVRAYGHTYGLVFSMSHCSNNFGPFQHGEKFIPRMIQSFMEKSPFPVYGNGKNVRDWIFVDDHVEAIALILEKGVSGQTYNIGARQERSNLELLKEIIDCCSALCGVSAKQYHASITFVPDRLGHDFRYAIDPIKIEQELGWQPKKSMIEGLKETAIWYLEQGRVCR